jgi:hypothetical protein
MRQCTKALCAPSIRRISDVRIVVSSPIACGRSRKPNVPFLHPLPGVRLWSTDSAPGEYVYWVPSVEQKPPEVSSSGCSSSSANADLQPLGCQGYSEVSHDRSALRAVVVADSQASGIGCLDTQRKQPMVNELPPLSSQAEFTELLQSGMARASHPNARQRRSTKLKHCCTAPLVHNNKSIESVSPALGLSLSSSLASSASILCTTDAPSGIPGTRTSGTGHPRCLPAELIGSGCVRKHCDVCV